MNSLRNNRICKAIKEGKVINFFYEGGNRTIEPHCLGYLADNKKMVLVGYQIAGYSESNLFPPIRCFAVASIRNLAITDLKIKRDRVEINSDFMIVNPICSKESLS